MLLRENRTSENMLHNRTFFQAYMSITDNMLLLVLTTKLKRGELQNIAETE